MVCIEFVNILLGEYYSAAGGAAYNRPCACASVELPMVNRGWFNRGW